MGSTVSIRKKVKDVRFQEEHDARACKAYKAYNFIPHYSVIINVEEMCKCKSKCACLLECLEEVNKHIDFGRGGILTIMDVKQKLYLWSAIPSEGKIIYPHNKTLWFPEGLE
jgi:hypothetical protein